MCLSVNTQQQTRGKCILKNASAASRSSEEGVILFTTFSPTQAQQSFNTRAILALLASEKWR